LTPPFRFAADGHFACANAADVASIPDRICRGQGHRLSRARASSELSPIDSHV